jgi:hypothetical protein
MLLGYAGSVADLANEGALFAKKVLIEGLSVKNGWFESAAELQSQIGDEGDSFPVWPGVLYPRLKGDVGTADNSLWDEGPTARPPAAPDEFVAFWTPA